MAENSEKWKKTILAYRTYIRLEKNLAKNSIEAYIRDLTDFAHFILRMYDVPPTKVEQYMIERYMGFLFERQRTKSSQARELSSIKGFYTYLLLTDRIETLPTEFVSAPKAGRHLPDTLSVEEIERIINSISPQTAKGRRDRAMLELLYSCGLRVSELIALRMSDLFFGEGYIRVIGKGNKQRLVPIGSTARERIMLYIDDRREAVKAKTKCGDTLFLNNRGSALTRVMVFLVIRQAVANAGIDKRVSPHTFRHSFASHLLAGGAGIRQVQEMLGHESIVTTEIYTHLDKSHLRDTVEKLTL
ncbi:MAG: tyrosine recombinase XerD [Alistipes sp.]|jgi:integrase/recombinase XerD|nr:tyrosine recombinase XerD [Alistipes sp.]